MKTAEFKLERVGSQPGEIPPSDESAVRDEINEIIAEQADAIIRKILAHRLRLHLNSHQDVNLLEAEDLYQTVILKFFVSLNRQSIDLLPRHADQVISFIAAIAHNVCNDFLRMKYPERNRLKNRLRDLMRRHPEFSCWKRDNKTYCGYKKWFGQEESPLAIELLTELKERSREAEIGKLSVERLAGLSFTNLITELFGFSGGPIDIDRLVRIVAKIQGIKDQPEESLDDEMAPMIQLASSPTSSSEHLEVREFLRRLWKASCELPENQRKTFILTSADYAGESLLHRILREQIVTVSQIYEALAMTRREMIAIWDKLPMDTQTVAGLMGTNTNLVAKWRHRALNKLASVFGVDR